MYCYYNAEGEALTWDTRLKIAIEAAQGLTFLHNSEKSVIYRDFKASNILLDSVRCFKTKLYCMLFCRMSYIISNSLLAVFSEVQRQAF